MHRVLGAGRHGMACVIDADADADAYLRAGHGVQMHAALLGRVAVDLFSTCCHVPSFLMR